MTKHKRSHHYAAAGLTLALFAGMTSIGFINSEAVTGMVAAPMVLNDGPMPPMAANQMMRVSGFDPSTGVMMQDAPVRQANLPWMQQMAGTEAPSRGAPMNTRQPMQMQRMPSTSAPIRSVSNGSAREQGAPALMQMGLRQDFQAQIGQQRQGFAGKQAPQFQESTDAWVTQTGTTDRPMTSPSRQPQLWSGPQTQGNPTSQNIGSDRASGADTEVLVARLEKELAKIEAKIEVTEDKLDAIATELQAATTDTAKKRLERSLKRTEQKLSDLEGAAENIEERIAELTAEAMHLEE